MLRNPTEGGTPNIHPLAFPNEKLSNLPLSGWFFRPLLDHAHLINSIVDSKIAKKLFWEGPGSCWTCKVHWNLEDMKKTQFICSEWGIVNWVLNTFNTQWLNTASLDDPRCWHRMWARVWMDRGLGSGRMRGRWNGSTLEWMSMRRGNWGKRNSRLKRTLQ